MSKEKVNEYLREIWGGEEEYEVEITRMKRWEIKSDETGITITHFDEDDEEWKKTKVGFKVSITNEEGETNEIWRDEEASKILEILELDENYQVELIDKRWSERNEEFC